jgi:hypothetical protein
MTVIEYFSIGISVISGLIAFGSWLTSRVSAEAARESAEAARKSAEMTEQLNRETRDTRDVATINACNQRYLEWRSRGVDFGDKVWSYGMWDLHATEFNFFRKGWIPLFMFRFWMNTLGTWYAEDDRVWRSHQDYLATYSGSLTEMEDFFEGIWEIARNNKDNVAARNRKVEDYVGRWARNRGLAKNDDI